MTARTEDGDFHKPGDQGETALLLVTQVSVKSTYSIVVIGPEYHNSVLA